MDDLASRLAALAGTPGVRFAALVDREGFLIESAGEAAMEADVAGALASCLAESSDGIGTELGHGALLGMILEYESYEFMGASNGPEGIALVQRDRPDMVLLDIKMPGMDGMEVLRKLRALDDTLPIVMISGHGSDEHRALVLRMLQGHRRIPSARVPQGEGTAGSYRASVQHGWP